MQILHIDLVIFVYANIAYTYYFSLVCILYTLIIYYWWPMWRYKSQFMHGENVAMSNHYWLESVRVNIKYNHVQIDYFGTLHY